MFLVKKYFTTVCMLYLATAASLEASWLKKFNAAFPKSAFFKPTTLWPRTTSLACVLGTQQHDQQKKWWQGNSHFKKFSFYALLSSIGLMKAAQQTVQAEDTPTAAQEPQTPTKHLTPEDIAHDQQKKWWHVNSNFKKFSFYALLSSIGLMKATQQTAPAHKPPTPTKHLTPEDIAQDNTFSDSISWRFFSKNFEAIDGRFDKFSVMYENSTLPLATIFSREAEHAQEHEVFYHAHRGTARFLHDLFAEFGNFLHEHANTNFVYFRDPIQNTESKTYLSQHDDAFDSLEWQRQQEGYLQWWDAAPNIKAKLLSVNAHLFGNIFSHRAECTIMYYAHNKSIHYSDDFLIEWLKNYGLITYSFTTEAQQLLDIQDKVATYGNLLQIFVPKNRAKDCVYIAHPGGKAVCEGQKCMKHKQLLRRLGLTQTPALVDTRENLQARIILDHNIMLNPASGVKIFRYTTMAAEDDEKYRHEMKKAITEMFIAWLERIKLGRIESEVLERIDKTELGQKILKRFWLTGVLLPKPVAIDEEIAKLKAKLATLSMQEG